MAKVVQRAGIALMVAGAACLAAILILVLVNGSWPDYLEPVRSRFELAHRLVGNFAFEVEVGLFLLPGGLTFWLGERMGRRQS